MTVQQEQSSEYEIGVGDLRMSSSSGKTEKRMRKKAKCRWGISAALTHSHLATSLRCLTHHHLARNELDTPFGWLATTITVTMNTSSSTSTIEYEKLVRLDCRGSSSSRGSSATTVAVTDSPSRASC